jgi:hypothetical protein
MASNIERVTGVDVFDKRRTLEVVDARSLFCYVLYKNFRYKLTEIRNIIRKHRPYSHATVKYNINLYETDVQFRRPEMEELRLELINQYSPYFLMLKKAKAIDDESIMLDVINLIDQYETTKQKRVDLCDASCD